MKFFSRYIVLYLLLLELSTVCSLAGEVIKVGAYQNPPKIFTTPDGRTTGIFPDILDDIAKEHNWKIEYVHGTWQQCLDRLKTGKIDLMVDMAVSEERKRDYDFSEEPVLVNWGTAFCRKDISIDSFLDMKNRTVAVMRGSIHTEGNRGIKALTSQFGVPCRFIEVDTYHEVLMLLDSKEADVGIVNRLFGTLHGGRYEVSPTPIIFNPRMLVFAVRKGSERGDRLLEIIDKALAKAKERPDSVYHQVLAYYLGGGKREWRGQSQRYGRPLNLNADERRWIKEHPRIRFTVDTGFAPFEFVSKDGEYRGMAADFLNLVAQTTGLKFELNTRKTWSESVQAVRDHEIDLLPCVGYSEERKRFLSYSEPYLKFTRVIVTRMDSRVRGLKDLTGMRLAVQVDSSHHAFVKEKTVIKPKLYKTFEECLLAVSRGDVDATIGNLAVTTHHIQNLALTNVKLAAYAAPEPQVLAFGVRRDWPELTSIINKALASVTMQQRNAILARWLPLPRAVTSNRIDLTQQEREWLLMHPRIRVGWDPAWAPIEFAGANGAPQGISMEYLNAVGNMLGVQFDMGKAVDWQTTYAKLKKRDIDMSSCLAITPERLEHLDFTMAYLNSPVVLFARHGTPYIQDISELGDLRVAVVKDYATDEWISQDHPELSVTRAASIADGFRLLSQGDVDVFMCSVLPGNYYLSKQQYQGIKIVGETPYTYKLRMAVRSDWPVFTRILQKALAALPETDQTAFYRKWVWVKYEHGFDYSLFVKVVLIALVIILVFAYWNRRLRTEVRRRKEAQAAQAESENALRDSYEDLKKLEDLKENLTNMIVHDLRSPLTAITGSLELMEKSPGKYLDIAKSGVQRATNMTQALLDISRLEAGKMPLERVEIDMQEIAGIAIQTLEIQAKLAKVELIRSGVSSRGKADPEIIRRVLVNLIGNAIKASPKGKAVEILTIDEDNQMKVEIRDSGCGIPKAFHQSLFDKFTTIEAERQQRSSVGLGLAFCKLAVEAHGGRIWMESEEGQGSTFGFSIPKDLV